MEQINLPNLLEFRNEDNLKFSRLEKLHEIINIKYNNPLILQIDDFINNTSKIEELKLNPLIKKCNIRLIPKNPVYQKKRIRATTFVEGLIWLENLKFDENNYKHIEIIPYNDSTVASAIFLINDKGIVGETLEEDLWQLTFGTHQKEPTIFTFNFNTWKFSKHNNLIENLVKTAIKKLHVEDNYYKDRLQNELTAEFTTNGYLKGYFEFIVWPGDEILFMDYNRIIPKIIPRFDFIIAENEINNIQGKCASPGMAHSKAKIILDSNDMANFEINDILVCKNITLDYAPLMKIASAIIVEQGNILSHATIISRELKKPCLVMVKDATTKIKNGDELFIDANSGSISIIK